MEVVLEIPFLAFNNADIQFDTKSFPWRFYNTAKALPITRRVELIDKHKSAKAALDKKSEMFVIHIVALEALKKAIHPS